MISLIEYYLPRNVVTTASLASDNPTWNVEKVDSITGISTRHVAAQNQSASDLAFSAAAALLETSHIDPSDIDFVLHVTQSPDYALPGSASLIHERLAIPSTAGSLDINMGSSGYVYALGVANGLIKTGQASTILLLTADAFSKFISETDRATRMIFSDAGTASIIQSRDKGYVGPFVYGTDGSGRESMKYSGNGGHLHMDGMEISRFALDTVPLVVHQLSSKAGVDIKDIDLFIFHQSNKQILEHVRRKIGVDQDRYWNCLTHGNTTSSSIPIALKDASRAGKLRRGMNVMLVGYGPGYSWAGTILRW